MSKDRSPVVAGPPNAGDVIEGPVGAASLRQPSPSGPAGVELEALASIDVKGGPGSAGEATDRSGRSVAQGTDLTPGRA